MKWISEETLKDCQIFRYSKMENGKEGVIPVKVEDLPGIEVGSDWGSPDGDKTVFLRLLGRESEDDV
jgi:hypothetical protein